MFQNIAEGNIQNDKEKVKLNNKIWLICKELFKFQNIVIYIITLLISMISMLQSMRRSLTVWRSDTMDFRICVPWSLSL